MCRRIQLLVMLELRQRGVERICEISLVLNYYGIVLRAE